MWSRLTIIVILATIRAVASRRKAAFWFGETALGEPPADNSVSPGAARLPGPLPTSLRAGSPAAIRGRPFGKGHPESATLVRKSPSAKKAQATAISARALVNSPAPSKMVLPPRAVESSQRTKLSVTGKRPFPSAGGQTAQFNRCWKPLTDQHLALHACGNATQLAIRARPWKAGGIDRT